jgi:AcrR family transcriptional regulator
MYLVKEQILMTAFDLFSQYGIKSVSMDDIARNVAISKRTLYESFADKETLLVEGIGYTRGKFFALLSRLEKESHTAIDILLLAYEDIMKHPRWYSRKFYEDVKRYPRAMKKIEDEKEKVAGLCSRLLNRGVKEGIFQGNVNFEIMVLLVKEHLKMLAMPLVFSGHSNKEIYGMILITFLRGISTDKGRSILDRWIAVKTYYTE